MQSDSRSNLVSVLIKFSVNLVPMLACKMGVTNRDNHFRFINMTLTVNNGCSNHTENRSLNKAVKCGFKKSNI